MNPAVVMMLKKLVPMVKDKAVPGIAGMLDKFTKEVTLQEGEEFACVMLSEYQGEWWAFVVTMSSDNQIKRIIHNIKLCDLVELGLQSLDQLC